MEQEGGPQEFSDEELASLLKSTLRDDFRQKEIHTLSTQKHRKLRKRRRNIAEYRRINRYYKSIKQFKKEKARRDKVLKLRMVEFRTQQQIADKLKVSVSTVKRDLKKLHNFIVGQINQSIRLMQQERQRKFQEEYEGLSLWEKFDYLSKQIELQKKIWQHRGYRGHYTIFHLDLTQTDKYGIPKLTQLPRQTANKTMAYPYKVRVHVKWEYEGRIFEADLGGFDITQRTQRGWF